MIKGKFNNDVFDGSMNKLIIFITKNENTCELAGLRTPDHKVSWYNKNQLLMGIEVEKEHFDLNNDNPSNILIKASCIARHHLDEMPKNYYTKLLEMEKEG